MSFLLDTNVISELRKGPDGDAGVAAWIADAPRHQLFTSVLVVGELRRGIELARRRDPQKAAVYENWLARVEEIFEDRTYPVDRRIADEWGQLGARRPIAAVDGLLAATARIHGHTLVTRNAKDVADLGVDVLDPFTAGSRR